MTRPSSLTVTHDLESGECDDNEKPGLLGGASGHMKIGKSISISFIPFSLRSLSEGFGGLSPNRFDSRTRGQSIDAQANHPSPGIRHCVRVGQSCV